MGILCNEPDEQALVTLGSIYTISCKTYAGGYCENIAGCNLQKLNVLPGLDYESYIPLIRQQILKEAKLYARAWLHDARKIRITFPNNIFDPKKRYVNLNFDDIRVATYTIRDKYEFEKS